MPRECTRAKPYSTPRLAFTPDEDAKAHGSSLPFMAHAVFLLVLSRVDFARVGVGQNNSVVQSKRMRCFINSGVLVL